MFAVNIQDTQRQIKDIFSITGGILIYWLLQSQTTLKFSYNIPLSSSMIMYLMGTFVEGIWKGVTHLNLGFNGYNLKEEEEIHPNIGVVSGKSQLRRKFASAFG